MGFEHGAFQIVRREATHYSVVFRNILYTDIGWYVLCHSDSITVISMFFARKLFSGHSLRCLEWSALVVTALLQEKHLWQEELLECSQVSSRGV